MIERISLLALLKQGIDKLGISLSDEIQLLLIDFIELLLKWNKVYNLTSIDDPERIITHHILDSLSIVPYIQGPNVLDIGSGAGFPGLPCALALPDSHFYLLDSNGKKTRFITQAVATLAIKNIKVVHSRVEDYQPSNRFNSILVRAVSSIDNIIEMTKHLILPEGELLIMKGIYPETELQKIGKHAKVHRLIVPELDEQRHLVCIKGFFNE